MQDVLSNSRSMSVVHKGGAPNGFFVDLVRRDFSPVVMVLSTASAEAVCQKNGLSFVDLIRPFCDFQNVNVPVRTASEQSYRIQDFRVRPTNAQDIGQPRTETAEEYLTQVVTDAGEEALRELGGQFGSLEALTRVASNDAPDTWYHRYMREFARTLAFSEHEAIDHPVGCFLVLSTADGDPLSRISELYTPGHMPALYTEQAMDPKMQRYLLLLHDAQTGPADGADEALQRMRAAFGPDLCRLLVLNRREENQAALLDIWSDFMPPRIAPPPTLEDEKRGDALAPAARVAAGERGRWLTEADVRGIQEMLFDYVSKLLIPHMESRIRDLNQQVSAQRKGLKNQLKSLLGFRKGKEEAPEATAGLYTFSSQESQIRVLADYALMLRDYELALASYKLVAGDYKTDKAWKRYAGAQEMIGLCLFLLNQGGREMEYSMETAYASYQRSGSGNAAYATRCVMWFCETYKARGMFREAAVLLMKASLEENSLRAGMLLEQGANAFLRMSPPMIRKFAFKEVLAGHKYNQCGQRKHAIRCYKSVVAVYEANSSWSFICDHVHFALGRLSGALADPSGAVGALLRVLPCEHQPPGVQATFLREFLFYVQSAGLGESGKPLPLPLPAINLERVHVHFEDHRTVSSAAAASAPEELWTGLEERVVPMGAALPTWMDAAARRGGAEVVATNTCVAGEEVGIDVELVNPLQVNLDVSCLRLRCEWSAPVVEEAAGKKAPIIRTASTPALEQAAPAAPLPAPGLLDDNPHHKGHSQSAGASRSTSALVPLEDGESVNGETNSVVAEEAAEGPVRTDPEEPADNEPPFVVRDEAFCLKPGEKAVVRLKVEPRREGSLRVVGVEWILANIALGSRDFNVKGVRRKRGKMGGGRDHPPHLRLLFKVIAPMPRLDATLHGLPERAVEGEVYRLMLELSNPSSVSLKKLKLRTSDPLVLLVGQPGDQEREYPQCLFARGGAGGGGAQAGPPRPPSPARPPATASGTWAAARADTSSPSRRV